DSLVSSGFATVGETFNPVTNLFQAVGSLPSGISSHAAVALDGGKVALAGGNGNGGTSAAIALYDPASQTFASAGLLAVSRGSPVAVPLAGSKLFIAGGFGQSAASWDTAEIVDLSAPLPAGNVNVPYNAAIAASGTSPFAFGLLSGALPPGLQLNASTGA